MAPESERANEVVRYDHCSKCESAIAQIGHWEHIDKFMDDDHQAHPKAADSWRERRVQELEAFKKYVHDRLDAMGVPHSDPESEHDKAGCRIGGRLDIVEKALANSEWREQIRKGAKHE